MANDWLNEMEKKLDLTTFTDDECVGATTHQLKGATRTWWDSFSDSHEDPANISWEEFTKAFTEYHIPKGVMEAKAMEFHNIQMGKDKVMEYTTHFTNLLRYAPSYVVNSEKEKLYYYHKGLKPQIKLKFGGIKSSTLCALVDHCIQIKKDCAEAGEEDRERKRKPEGSFYGRDRKRFHRDAPPRERSRHYRDDNLGSSRGSGGYTAKYSRLA
ncbi:uncharacterized protein [Miscanthus floridulus]|uniref:uncharacterized protein n=1 Tax=Miscanthus floridulus TaxID=154761 RepID=UPI00345B3E53